MDSQKAGLLVEFNEKWHHLEDQITLHSNSFAAECPQNIDLYMNLYSNIYNMFKFGDSFLTTKFKIEFLTQKYRECVENYVRKNLLPPLFTIDNDSPEAVLTEIQNGCKGYENFSRRVRTIFTQGSRLQHWLHDPLIEVGSTCNNQMVYEVVKICARDAVISLIHK